MRFNDILELRVSWPPSVNHCYAQVGKRRYLTPEARRYKEEVAWLMQSQARHQNFKKFDEKEKLQVFLRAYPPDRRKRDEDNIKKILYDTLIKGDVISDDSQIKRVTTDFLDFDDVTKAGVEIYISSFRHVDPLDFIRYCSDWG